jgi:hypothetical protein
MTTTTGDSPPINEEGHAWPFVVTRNRLLDWRPIVAPDFMITRGGEYLLVHAADPGDAPCPSPVFERIVTTNRYGDLTLLAKSLQATADLIGGPPSELLLDRAGRSIQLIEGLVLQGRHPGAAPFWEDQLRSVDSVAHEAFPEFWRSEDEAAPPAPSRALTGTQATVTTQISGGEFGVGAAIADIGRPGGRGWVSLGDGMRSNGPVRTVVITAICVIAGLGVRRILVRAPQRRKRDRHGL